MRRWTAGQSVQFWGNRPWSVVARDDNLVRKQREMQEDCTAREERRVHESTVFIADNTTKHQSVNAQRFLPVNEAENIMFWACHGSWTHCALCKQLHTLRLLPRYADRPIVKATSVCPCGEERYVTPDTAFIPDVLKNLSFAEICVLRPLTVHCGDYSRAENGYRRKTTLFRLSWSKEAVEDKIQAMSNVESRTKCQNAYAYLMSEEASSYRDFVDLRAESVARNKSFNVYDLTQRKYVECCVWPHLYPTRDWCETALDGKQSRESFKAAFLTKVKSCIADYGMDFELLQFHYDIWLFKTVSGAISIGRATQCSPARSLETKTFSTEYWKWQHRFLIDAVAQFGKPSLFVTISPYEWTFPFPPWLLALRNKTGRGPTQLAAFETFHISHVLEQIIRGYLCGSNDKKWTSHVFNYNHIASVKNVQTYFYRFEFQNRGTLHVHLLVWLKNISRIRLPLLRGDIPWSDKDLSYLVSTLQKSDKKSLSLREGSTTINDASHEHLLLFHHPADAFALNLRAYISSLTPSLRCRMDVQASDGNNMILRYVSSYVSKWQDAYDHDALYSSNVGPHQAAYKHVRSLKPLEPEMWMSLTASKISWTTSRRKKFRIPPLDQLLQKATYQKYLARPATQKDLSLLQWLRLVDDSKKTPSLYKDGNTLVGVKTVSPLKDLFYFQYLLLHYPHVSPDALKHQQENDLPPQIKHFAAAYTLLNNVWSNSQLVAEYFRNQGHKNIFVETVVNHVESLADFFHLWQRRVLTFNMSDVNTQDIPTALADPMQNRVVQVIKISLQARDSFYEETGERYFDNDDRESSDIDDDETADVSPRRREHLAGSCVDWRNFVLVTGKPGTGKSHCVRKAINDAVNAQRDVLVATPTGFLSTTYAAAFPGQITTDTVHSAFKFPVLLDENPEINWELSNYDLIILDEISMIPKTIVNHIIETISQIPIRPVVVMCGDRFQQQPIESSGNSVSQQPSILEHGPFFRMVTHVNLTTQHRCDDPAFEEMLNHLRYYKPTQRLLDTMQENRILCNSSTPADKDIETALIRHPLATMITVSRAACNRVNQLAVSKLFAEQEPLTVVQCDCALPPMPICKGMNVIITQNRDKANGFVNGQRATVFKVQRNTIFLKLPSQLVVNTYLVTYTAPDGTRKTVYPFVPGYAITICKSQGQTLKKAIIWMDSLRVPPGAAYVALSRVKRHNDLYFLTETTPSQYQPVSFIGEHDSYDDLL